MPNINWSKLVDPSFWLEGVAGSVAIVPIIPKDSFFFWGFLYLFSGLFIAGVSIRVWQIFLDEYHPLQKQLPLWGNNLILMGVFGLGWFLMRQLSVGLLGARLWVLLGSIWFLVVLGLAIHYFIIYFPLEIQYYKKNKKSSV
jgi:hypothetical protein